MANTYTRILLHIVFSTKQRVPMIPEAVAPSLHSYIGGICRNLESPLLAAGGMPDHVHLLVLLSKKIAVADLVMHVKKDSSKWFKPHAPGFSWQDGYAAFSIGESGRADVERYIATQKEHHQTRTFKEELIALLIKYGFEFEEKYLDDDAVIE